MDNLIDIMEKAAKSDNEIVKFLMGKLIELKEHSDQQEKMAAKEMDVLKNIQGARIAYSADIKKLVEEESKESENE